MHDYAPTFLADYLNTLTWVDLILVGILLVSTLWGWVRGMIGELLGLLGWILGFWGARLGTPLLAPYLTPITQQTLRWAVAFIIILVIILITVKILSSLLQKGAAHLGLKGLDGLLGATFGFLRGAVLDLILLLLAGTTPLPHESAWTNARFIPLAMKGVTPVLHWLPSQVAQYFHY
ncbi:MAG: CvpA family protein [Betaproteobacteria bacterium]|jgi:Uncharacterized membrane protein, required for colicin V production|nr:CvpA family protein [Betaproteobacteria bacterium]